MSTLDCPSCTVKMEVSEDDVDATLSEMLGHLRVKHAGYDRKEALRLLALVKES